MASGDFQDLYTKAIYGSRRDPSDTFDVARAKEAINEALLTVSYSGDPWNWLEKEGEFTLEAGSDVYSYDTIGSALGTSVGELFAFVMDTGDGGYRLEAMTWEALEDAAYSTQDGEQQGEPIYRAAQTELSANSDVPLMPLQWRTRLLVPYACMRLLRQEGGAEAASEADRYFGEYQRAFNDCRTACATAKRPAMRLDTPVWRDQMWFGR